METARRFTSAYLRNRCLLKLAAWLPAGELDALFARFMEDVRKHAPSSEMMRKHFDEERNFCEIRGAAICY